MTEQINPDWRKIFVIVISGRTTQLSTNNCRITATALHVYFKNGKRVTTWSNAFQELVSANFPETGSKFEPSLTKFSTWTRFPPNNHAVDFKTRSHETYSKTEPLSLGQTSVVIAAGFADGGGWLWHHNRRGTRPIDSGRRVSVALKKNCERLDRESFLKKSRNHSTGNFPVLMLLVYTHTHRWGEKVCLKKKLFLPF